MELGKSKEDIIAELDRAIEDARQGALYLSDLRLIRQEYGDSGDPDVQAKLKALNGYRRAVRQCFKPKFTLRDEEEAAIQFLYQYPSRTPKVRIVITYSPDMDYYDAFGCVWGETPQEQKKLTKAIEAHLLAWAAERGVVLHEEELAQYEKTASDIRFLTLHAAVHCLVAKLRKSQEGEYLL